MISKRSLKHALALLISALGGGFINYLFNIFMGRLLTPGDYAAVVAVFSFFAIISVPVSTIQTVAVKYSAELNAKNKTGAIKHFMLSLSGKMLIPSIIFTVLKS